MPEWLTQPEIAALAEEKSVRGRVVRLAVARAEQVDKEQAALLEEALQELLARFEGTRFEAKS